MRVLIIEDDQRLARLIARALTDERYQVEVAHDGETGLDMALTGTHEVAVIDWMLPGRDGPAICRAVRQARIPLAILLLTARSQVEDRVLGLDSGADDYLGKPFAFSELLARVRALSRRYLAPGSDGAELRCGTIVLDMRAHTGRRGDIALDLTATEWSLLEYLLRNAGQTLTRGQILDHVWPFDRAVQETIVDVYISYLRRKLQQPGRDDPIHTLRGVGYRLEADRA
jgi:DNA-binding response OmpR family regulator